MSAEHASDDVLALRALLGAIPDDPTPTAADAYDDARDGAILAAILASSAAHEPADRPGELAASAAPGGPATPPAGAGPARATVRHLVQRRSARRRWTTISVAACLLAAVGAVVGPMLGDRAPAYASRPPMLHFQESSPGDLLHEESTPPARDVLLELADAAGARTDVPAGPVQYVESVNWFQTVTGEQGGTEARIEPVRQQTWLQADGAYRSVELRGGGFEPSGRLVLPDETTTDRLVDQLPAGSFGPLAPDLPRDAAELRSTVLAQAGDACPEEVACVGAAFVELAAVEVVPGDLDAAFLTALAADDDVSALGRVTDRLGREGEAVGYVSQRVDGGPTEVSVLIVSPQDGRLLAFEKIRQDDELYPDGPAVVELRVLERSSWVPAIGDRPPG